MTNHDVIIRSVVAKRRVSNSQTDWIFFAKIITSKVFQALEMKKVPTEKFSSKETLSYVMALSNRIDTHVRYTIHQLQLPKDFFLQYIASLNDRNVW